MVTHGPPDRPFPCAAAAPPVAATSLASRYSRVRGFIPAKNAGSGEIAGCPVRSVVEGVQLEGVGVADAFEIEVLGVDRLPLDGDEADASHVVHPLVPWGVAESVAC